MNDVRGQRDRWLEQSDATLLGNCDVDTYRASGPGGQHRNKTSSAIRLRHRPSGVCVIAEESRSQHENKARALRRLRLEIALAFREPIDEAWDAPETFRRYRTRTGRLEIARRNRDHPRVVAIVLDALAASEGRLRDAGSLLGLTTGQFSRFAVTSGKLREAANRIRRSHGLGPLSTGK